MGYVAIQRTVEDDAARNAASDLSPAEIEPGAEPAPVVKGTGSSLAILYSLAGRAGLLLLDSATGIVCARVLGPEGRGALSAMILWPVFLSGAFTLGLPSAIIYSLRREKGRGGPLIAAAIVLGLVMAIFTACAGVVILPYWLHLYSPETIHHAQWFMAASLFSMAALIFRGIWESTGGFGRSAGAQILSRVGTLSGLSVFFLLHRLTPFTAALCYTISGLPPFLWMCAAIVPQATWRWQQWKSSVRVLLSYGLRSYGIDLCGALSQYIDQALVLGLLSASEMGTYTVSLSLSRILNVISVSMAAVLFPKTVGETPQRAVRLAVRTLIGSLTLGLVGAAFIYFFGAFLLNLLYGRAYLVGTDTLKILTVEAILSGSLTIMSQPFMALGRPGTVTLLQIFGLLTSIPLIMILVPHYGPVGASMALVCSALVRAGLLAMSYRRVFPESFNVSIVREEAGMLIGQLQRRLISQTSSSTSISRR
jgi:O-antigen/teichoic acid export membrane protein